MIRVFPERYDRIDFNILPAESENFLPNKSDLEFLLQTIISQKRQQQQYTTNCIAYYFLSILQVTCFARNINKIVHLQGRVVIFPW